MRFRTVLLLLGLAVAAAGCREAAPPPEAAAPQQTTTLGEAVAAMKAPSQGPADAAVTVYEIGNYTCPFCQEAHPVIARLLGEYPGKVRFVFIPYVRQYDKASQDASVAAMEAWEQGKFIQLHDLLFQSAPDLSPAKLSELASKAGLDVAKVAAAVSEGKRMDELKRYLDVLHSFDVWGTPTVLIGDQVLKGAQGYETYKAAIDAALARAGGKGASRERFSPGRLADLLFPRAFAAEPAPASEFGPGCAPLFVKVGPALPLNPLKKKNLKVGDKAPAFTLPSIRGGSVSLADFAGKKNVLLAFLPAAFTPV